jgi:hypothetical protein
MPLLLFWVKVIIKRILNLSKPYLLITLCVIIFIGAFVYAFINEYIVIKLDIKTIYIIISSIILLSLFNSFRNYHLLPILIKYSKSKYHNKNICIRYFLKQSLVNNFLLIIFNIIAYNSIIKYSVNNFHLFILFGITILSILSSLIIMYVKYNYLNKKHTELNHKKPNINPLIKSALYDYLSSDFLSTSILCIVVFIVFIIHIISDTNHIFELKNNSDFFIIITVIFSVGFTGIIGSIPKINWKFQAIISKNSIKYHIRRTFLVLTVFFGWLILLFIIFGSLVDVMLTMKYLYCIFVILFTTVNISFSTTNLMMKAFIITTIIVLTVWVSTLPVSFLSILLFPVIFTFIKAKNEYREWSLL